MKTEFVVYRDKEDYPEKRFDTYEEAQQYIEKSIPRGLLGTVEFFIRKVFSNRD